MYQSSIKCLVAKGQKNVRVLVFVYCFNREQRVTGIVVFVFVGLSVVLTSVLKVTIQLVIVTRKYLLFYLKV